VKDPDKSIQAVVDGVSKAAGDKIEVIAFDRFELGQG
jgi:translation elongation factor EF-Ts